MQLFNENFNNYYEPIQLEEQMMQVSMNWDYGSYQSYVQTHVESVGNEELHHEIYTDNLVKTLDLIHDRRDLLLLLAVVKEINDYNQLKRLDCWLGYFLLYWENKPSQFNLMITSLLSQYCLNGYIHSQTTFEFEVSKQWLSDFLKENIDFYEDFVASYLLTISVIIGSNPGIINKSQKVVFKEYENKKLTSLNVPDFFNSIFTKFPIPNFLVKQLLQFDFDELKIIVELLYGKNIRNCRNLPVSISKKESQIFRLEINHVFEVETNRIKSNLVLAKLISSTDHYNQVALYHLTRTKTFTKNIDLLIADLSYWTSVYSFAVQINRGLTEEVRLEEFYAYFESLRYIWLEQFNFEGRTIQSIMRLIISEREEALFKQETGYKWKKKYNTFTLKDENDISYEFVELTSGKQLYAESKIMKHCVFEFYTFLCFSDNYSIVSLRKIVNNNSESLITIALKQHKLLEARGKFNREPNHEERVIINKWFKKMNVKTSKYNWNEQLIA